MTPTNEEQGFHEGGDRRATSPMSPIVLTTYITLGVTLCTLIFTAGWNLRGIAEVSDKHDKFEVTVISDYVRKDVNAQQMITLENKLDAIAKQLENLQRGKQ